MPGPMQQVMICAICCFRGLAPTKYPVLKSAIMSAHIDVATQMAAPMVTAGSMDPWSCGPRIPIKMAIAIRAKPESGDQSVRPVVWATTRPASQSHATPAAVTARIMGHFIVWSEDHQAATASSTTPITVKKLIVPSATSSWRPPEPFFDLRLEIAAFSAGRATRIPAIAPPKIIPIPTLLAVKPVNDSTRLLAAAKSLPNRSKSAARNSFELRYDPTQVHTSRDEDPEVEDGPVENGQALADPR